MRAPSRLPSFKLLLVICLLPAELALLPMAAHADLDAPWPTVGGDRRHTGRADIVFPASASLRFRNTDVARFNYSGTVAGVDELGDDVVFGASRALGQKDAVWAVSADGDTVWKNDFASADGFRTNVTPYLDQAAGVLYLSGTTNRFYALSSATGAVLWERAYELDSGMFHRSSPVMGFEGELYFLSDTIWTGDRSYLFAISSEGDLSWSKDLGAYSHGDGSVAVLDDGNLVVVSMCFREDEEFPAGRVFKATPAGSIIWDYCHHDPFMFYGTPAVDDDGSIYFGANGQTAPYMIALNEDGTIKWETNGVGSAASPAIGLELIYIIDVDDNLTAILKDTGAVSWRIPVGRGSDRNRAAPVVDLCGNVIAASTGGRILAASPSGEILWEDSFEGQALGSISVGSDGTVYVRADGLYAFGGDGLATCDLPDDPPVDDDPEDPADDSGDPTPDPEDPVDDPGNNDPGQEPGDEDYLDGDQSDMDETQGCGCGSGGDHARELLLPLTIVAFVLLRRTRCQVRGFSQ